MTMTFETITISDHALVETTNPKERKKCVQRILFGGLHLTDDPCARWTLSEAHNHSNK